METWLSRSVERTVANACDLVVVTSVEPPEGAVAELVQRLLDATAPHTNTATPFGNSHGTVSEQATLITDAAVTPSHHITVLQVSPHEEAVRAKQLLDALVRLHCKSFPTILSTGWIDRSIVEAHGETVAAHLRHPAHSSAASLVIAQRPQTQLESLLCATARRRKSRQSAAASVPPADSDVDSCLVLYFDTSLSPTSFVAGSPLGAPSPSQLEEGLPLHASVSGMLEWLYRIVSERSLPLLEHIHDVDKGRLFLRLSTPDDAAKTRQLLVTLARDTSAQLREKINTVTLKPCSLMDFERVKRRMHE